jgi:2-polyprenyl-3-methyl-5-hydroxy-6-metoxy-1,4-benzoquinol methylase
MSICSSTADDTTLIMGLINISYQPMRKNKIGTFVRGSRLKRHSFYTAMIINRKYRLDLNHEILRLLWDNKLHECPLDEPHRILDIGTGTGIWAIDMADQYPMAEVIGTDLSPIQPDWVPANWWAFIVSTSCLPS